MEPKRAKNGVIGQIIQDDPKVLAISKEIIDQLKSEILQSVSSSPQKDAFCDFTVVVEDEKFPCHRFMLNACSGFFEALFGSDMKEIRELKATVRGMSPKTFRSILDVIYGRCEALVPDKMIDIWKGAHQLQIRFLVSACENYFMNNVNADNSYLIYTHAQTLQSPQVLCSVLNYMVDNFNALVQSEHLGEINNEDFLKIIRNENVHVCDDCKAGAILKWCETESKNVLNSNKLKLLENVFQAVDLTNVTRDCLVSLLTNALVQGNKKVNMAVNLQAARMLQNSGLNNAKWFNNEIKHGHRCLVISRRIILENTNLKWTADSDSDDLDSGDSDPKPKKKKS